MTERTGSCMCEAISFKTTSEPIASIICYCSDCRKSAGNIGHIVAPYNESDFVLEDPGKKLKSTSTTKTQSGKEKVKYFCGECGCTIYSTVGVFPGKIVVRPTMFDKGYPGNEPTMVLFEDTKEAYTEGVESKYY